jgi:hypothetical protein
MVDKALVRPAKTVYGLVRIADNADFPGPRARRRQGAPIRRIFRPRHPRWPGRQEPQQGILGKVDILVLVGKNMGKPFPVL